MSTVAVTKEAKPQAALKEWSTPLFEMTWGGWPMIRMSPCLTIWIGSSVKQILSYLVWQIRYFRGAGSYLLLAPPFLISTLPGNHKSIRG